MSNKKITYDIGFNVDNSNLQKVQTELQNISQMTLKDLKLIDPNATKADLEEIKRSAQVVGDAIETSFNPKLGTLNVDKFNTSLKNSGQTIAQIEANFAKMGATGKASFRNLTAEILTTQREIKQTSNFLDSMAKTLGNTIKWSIASSAVNMVTSSVQKAWGYTKKLDESLNDIRIVTGQSAEEMDKFAKQANKAAKSLGTATTDYTNAALIYYQQGLGDEDVAARTDVTLKAANVTGQSAAEVSEQLTAVWNGYKVVAEEAELYVDKLAAVAASTAADLEELSTGMSKVASAASTMGVDIDQLSAQLSTIVSVTRQDASLVGTALKTIYARMGDLEVSGVDEFGTSLGDVSGKLRQMGIEVLDQEGNLRDMGNVIEEVAAKWGTWTDAQQQAAAVAIAGKRQYNNLIALFENWDMYESALTTSKGSAGTLQKQQDTYMESIQAHLEQLGAAGERVYDAFFDSDSMKDMLDMLTHIVDAFASFVESIGGGGNLLLGFGSIAMRVFSGQIAGGISKVITNLGIMRQATIQNQAELEIQAQYAGASDEAVKKMVSIKETELKYSKLLTEEQKAQFEFYIKQTAELQNQVEEQEKQLENAKEYYELRFGEKVDFDAKRSSSNRVTKEKAATDLEDEASALETQLKGRESVTSIAKEERQFETISKQTDIIYKSHEDLVGLDDTGLQQKMEEAEAANDEEKISSIQELIEAKEKLAEIDEKQKKRENELNSTAQKLINSHKLSKDQTTELIEAKKNYNKGLISQAQYEQAIQKALQKTAQKHREVAEQIKKGDKPVKNAKKNADELQKSYKSFIKNVNMTAAVQGIVSMVSAIGSLATAISSLKNIGNIWDDESLSGGDKFLQTLSAIGSAAGMLAMSFSGLKKGAIEFAGALGLQNTTLGLSLALFKAQDVADKQKIVNDLAKKLGVDAFTVSENQSTLSILSNLAATKLQAIADGTATVGKAGSTAATIAQTVANWALNASMPPLLIVTLAFVAVLLILAAAIAAVVGIVVGLTKAFESFEDNGKKAFKAASEEAKAATEEFNRVKAAYDELKQSLEDYNNAETALEELMTGTDEWRQAVQELNMQVIELLNKYPQLAKYIDNVNGQLKISQAGQEAVLADQEAAAGDAYRTSLIAQNNADKAENTKTKAEGADDVLDVSNRQSTGLGMGIGATIATVGLAFIPYVGPILAMASGIIAASSYGSIADAAADEEDYNKVIDMVAEDETILSSKEAFSKAMEEAGMSDLTEALWSERDILLENAKAIEANTLAIKQRDQEIARSRLEETEAFQNIDSDEDKAVLTSIIAKETGSNSQAYKDAVKELGGDDVDDKEAEAFADKYASLMGIDAVETKVKDGVITYVDANGEEIKVNAKTAQTALAQEMAGANVTDSYVEGKIELLKQLEMAADSTGKSFGKLITEFAAGENADLSSGTSQQIEELQGVIDSYNTAYESATDSDDKGKDATQEKLDAGGDAFAQALGYANEEDAEEAAQKMGYKNLEEYKDAIQESIDNYNKEKRKLTLGLDTSIVQGLDSLKVKLAATGNDFEDFSLQTQKVIISSLKTAFEKGGSQGLNAFNQLIAEGGFNESEIQKISDAVAEVDWTSSGSVNDLITALNTAGIEIDENSNYWNSMVAAMEASTNVVQEVVNNLDELRGTLASIAEITDDIHLGDIISDEDYDTLVANNAELKKYFVMTADGYKYLGGAEEEFKKAKNNVLDVDEIKENFDNAKKEGESLLLQGKQSGFFKTDVKTGKVSVKAGEQEAFSSVLNSGNYDEILNATDYSAEQYKAKKAELSTGTSNYLKDVKLSDINAATDAQDLAKQLGFVDENGEGSIQKFGESLGYTGNEAFNKGNEILTNAMTDAKNRISDAETYVKNAETAVMNSLNQMQSGDWDQMSRDAQTAAVSGLAKNYDELKQYEDKLFNEDYNKLALTYLAEEATQLGVNADVWESYVQSVGEDLDLQEQYLNNIQALQVYDSADAYHYIEQVITDVTEELDKLADAQNRAFGKDVLSNIDKQIEKIKELADETDGLYKKRYDAKMKEAELTKASFVADQAYLNGIDGLSGVNLNDGITEEEYNTIFNKAQTSDTETQNALLEILKKILDYNNLVEDAETEYQEAIEESNQQVLDLQIEKYNQEIEMNREFRNTVKEWRNSMRDFKRFSSEGIAAFEELSASATLGNIMEELNEQGMAAASPESFAEITQLESWKNGGGINNPFVGPDGTFDANQFNEAYTAALETAQEDVQGFVDLGQELFDTWLSSLEEISTMYDEQVEKLSTINSLLESSANFNKLLGNSSKAYYSQMRQNAEQTVELYAAQVSQLEQQYNNFFYADGKLKDGVSQEQADVVWDAYIAAKQNHVDAIQAQYDAIVAEFETSMQEVVDDLFGGSLDNISEAWNLEKSADEMYFDDVNAEYEKYKFERAVQKSIDTTDSITAQNKLKNVLQEQLAILEKKDKLSQYDIDRANAMYELTLKQIALEEAQQTANKMKLTRDASGNYTYQYVADEDKIAQAQEELAAAENELYNLQKDHQSELIDTLISGVQEYQELTVKYMNDPEMLQKVQDHYATFFGNLKNDMSDLGMDVGELTEMFGSDMSTPWMETFDNLAAIDTESLLESTANLFSGEDGITAALTKVQDNFAAYLEAEKGMSERLSGYVTSVDDLNPAAGAVADKMADANSAMDTLVTNIGTLVDKLDSYVSTYTQYLGDITGNEEQKIAETTSENKDDDNEGLETAVVGTTAAVKESNVLLQVINDNLLKIPTFTPASGNFYPYPTAPEIVPTASSNSFATVAGFGVTNKTIGVGNSYTLPVIKP